MDICIWRVILGFFVSTIVGAFSLWLLIDKITWPYISKKYSIQGKNFGYLSLPLGIIERVSYTTALILGLPEWIAVWLAMKVAVSWSVHQTRKSPSDNLYLIGNLLSIMFGFLGAWISLGRLPLFK